MRIKFFQIATGLAFSFLVLVLFYTQLMRGERYRQLSQANCIRIIPQEGSRGRIFDRNDNILVDNHLVYNVAILPQETKEIHKTFRKLADILGVALEDLESQFKKGASSTSLPITLVSNIGREKAIIIEELKADLEGLLIQAVPQRLYPFGRLAAHLIGYLQEIDHWRLTKLKDYGYKTKDTIGYSGIEERYDYYLRPAAGGLQVEVDNQNRIVRVIAFRPPRNGRDIKLTIDLRLQKIAEDNLKGRRGAIIIMEPNTGRLLALASFPDFHPVWFINKSTILKKLLKDESAPFLNRAINGRYPPGSIFKLVLAACGLNSKKIDTKKTFYCSGKTKIGKTEFACWDIHETQNLTQAIAHSCNNFFYRLGLLLGADTISEYASRFGLGKITQIDLPGESGGYVPSPLRKRLSSFQAWFDGDTANFSIGQGELLVTPLQIARLMAVFANGGYLVRPFLIRAIDNKDVSNYQIKITSVPIGKEVFKTVNKGLKAVVADEGGTARILKLDAVTVAGKTGTSQVTRGESHAWFSGYFPVEQPKFVICVFLEHGGSSVNATLLAKNIIERMEKEGLL